MPHLSIHNIQLFYNFIQPSLLHSEKPLLVFLHEGLGCSEQWKDFHSGLCEQLSLPGFYYDRYGYGQSQEITESRQPDFLETEAEVTLPALFGKLNLSHVPKIIFGHSDGGTIALLFAAKFPEQTIAIITEAAHVINEDITMQGQRDVIKLYETTDLPVKLARYHGSKTDNMFRSWINVWQSQAMAHWSIEEKLKPISCPVLAIQGSNDNYGSPEQLKRIKTFAGTLQVQTILIENCGHIPHHQAREKVESLVCDFLKNLSQS